MALRVRRSTHRNLIVVAAALAGAALAAHPTGVPALDRIWSAAFAAALAAAGAWASPFVLLLASAAITAVMGSPGGLALAAGSVAASGWSTLQPRPSSRLTAVAGALLALAVLRRGDGDASLALVATTVGVVAVAASAWKGLRPRLRGPVAAVAGTLLVGVVVCAGMGLIAAARARSAADEGIDALRAARTAARVGDLDGALEQFEAAERALVRAHEPLASYGRLGRIVPGLSQQLGAGTTAVDTAVEAAGALRALGGAVRLDGVTVVGGALDLDAIRAAEGPLGEAVTVLEGSVRRLAGLDRQSLLPPIRDALDEAVDESREAARTVARAHRASQELPTMLGGAGTSRYLVLFTSPVEARNRFGFPGAYAVLRFEDGRIGLERAGPMDDIDPAGAFDQAAVSVPPRAAPFVPYGVSRNWRSVTLPSDGPAVAEVALGMAAQVGLGRLDGLVLADPDALAQIVDLVGGVTVPGLGLELDAANTRTFLVRDQYLAFPALGQQDDRKDALGLVAMAVGDRLSDLSVPEARTLVDRFGPLVEGGHLVVAVPPTAAASASELLADLGIDGGFPTDDADDVLYVGERNNVGNKIDLFLERSVAYDAQIDEQGQVTATLTVDLHNTAPGSGLPDYLIGSALADPPPSGTNITTVLIYSRHLLEGLTIDGQPFSPPALADGPLVVYQVPVELGPGQRSQVVAHLRGEAAGRGYAVRAYRTALAVPDALSVSVHDARDGEARYDGVVDRPRCVATRSGRCGP